MYMVLATLMVVVVLANVVLTIIASQSRLTHHQVSRIQAYYASMAGINYATEMLRSGNADWPLPAADESYTRTIRHSGSTPPDINESDLPLQVQNVTITISGKDIAGCDPPSGVPVCLSATADYTYTP